MGTICRHPRNRRAICLYQQRSPSDQRIGSQEHRGGVLTHGDRVRTVAGFRLLPTIRKVRKRRNVPSQGVESRAAVAPACPRMPLESGHARRNRTDRVQQRRGEAMANEDNVIDAEVVSESDNLPAVIPNQTRKRGTHAPDPPIEGRDWSTYSRPERRCTAHSSRTGDQCKNSAIKGHNVCRYHGGAAPQTKQAAQTRLDNASELMAKQLLGIALSAESEAVKLAAVKDALDRTIGKAPTTVEIGPTKPYEELFEGITTMSRGESRRARGVPDASNDYAGVDHAHLHASSQEGTECQSCTPPSKQDPADQNQPADPLLRRESLDLTTHPRDDGRQRQPHGHSGTSQATRPSGRPTLRIAR